MSRASRSMPDEIVTHSDGEGSTRDGAPSSNNMSKKQLEFELLNARTQIEDLKKLVENMPSAAS